MKTFLFTVLALSLLLDPGSSIAEPTHPNEVGLYMTTDGYGATGTSVMGVPVTVYLVMTKPTDVETGEPYQTLWGYALNLHFNPVPNNDLFFLGAVIPPLSVDIGRWKDINEGILEFVVAWSLYQDPPVMVVDEAAVLTEFTFMNLSPGSTEVTLGPVGAPSVGGELVFLGGGLPPYSDEGFPQRVMYPVGGSHDAPVFIFNGEAVAVENESFGSVKALYR
jgi:hypothetical protein